MFGFGNEYENRISELKPTWYNPFDDEVDLSYEIGILEDYERMISKIVKILDKYDDNKSRLDTYYNNVIDTFEDASSAIDSQRNAMSADVGDYVSYFEEKVDEVKEKINKKKDEVDADYEMIKTSITNLEDRKQELHDNFYTLYDECLAKKNG